LGAWTKIMWKVHPMKYINNMMLVNWLSRVEDRPKSKLFLEKTKTYNKQF
jgi:hypothetical protein